MAKLDNKTFSAAEIAKRIAEDAAVLAAQKRLEKVQARLRVTEAETERILGETERSRKMAVHEQAASLLHGDGQEDLKLESLQTELNKAREAAELLAKAVRLGETELDFARRQAAALVLQERQPELQERQRALIGHYAACSLATKQYREYLRTLQASGLDIDTAHIFTGTLDTGADHNSPFFTWCGSMIERGLLQQSDIPENLRRAWGVL